MFSTFISWPLVAILSQFQTQGVEQKLDSVFSPILVESPTVLEEELVEENMIHAVSPADLPEESEGVITSIELSGLQGEVFDFGVVKNGEQIDREILISNSGSVVLKNIVVQLASHSFKIVRNDCIYEIQPDQNCTVLVRYKAGTENGTKGFLEIHYGDEISSIQMSVLLVGQVRKNSGSSTFGMAARGTRKMK